MAATTDWTEAELAAIEAATELFVSTRRADGGWRKYLPIWAVVADGRVFVRTWHRRETGWYGRAVRDGRARVCVPDVETEVAVVDRGDAESAERTAVDAAYRRKYGPGIDRMIGDEAAGTTLRLEVVRRRP